MAFVLSMVLLTLSGQSEAWLEKEEAARAAPIEQRPQRLVELARELLAIYDDPVRARLFATEAQELLASNQPSELVAQCFIIQGDALIRFKDHAAAMVAYQKAINYAKEQGYWSAAVVAYERTVERHEQLGDYHAALAAEREIWVIADRHNLERRAAQSLSHMGSIHRQLGNDADAMDHYFRALEACHLVGDKRCQAQTLNDIGDIHNSLGNYYEALDFHLRAIDIKRQLDDPAGLAHSFANVGTIYKNIEDYKLAEQYHRLSFNLWQDIEDRAGVLRALINLGTAYVEMGDLEKGLEFLNRSLEHAIELDDLEGMANAKAQIATIFIQQNRLGEAEAEVREALGLNFSSQSFANAAINSITLSEIQQKQGDSTGSLASLQEAVGYASDAGAKSVLRDALVAMAAVEREQGKIEQATDHLFQAYALHEDLMNREVAQRINNLQAQHAIAQKQREIELLTRDNQIKNLDLGRQRLIRNGILILAALVLLVAVLLFGRYRQSVAANSRLQELNDQMNRQTKDLEMINSNLAEKTRQLSEKNEELYLVSVTDPLTEVFNRSYLIQLLERELSKVRRHQVDLSLLMIDFDHFKEINDTHGHLAGDAVLSEIAQLIQRMIRVEDAIARFGGEEFAVVLSNTDREQALHVAEKIRMTIAETEFEGHPDIKVTVSIGVLDHTACSELTINHLIACADAALYQAKDAGRNQSFVFEGALN